MYEIFIALNSVMFVWNYKPTTYLFLAQVFLKINCINNETACLLWQTYEYIFGTKPSPDCMHFLNWSTLWNWQSSLFMPCSMKFFNDESDNILKLLIWQYIRPGMTIIHKWHGYIRITALDFSPDSSSQAQLCWSENWSIHTNYWMNMECNKGMK